MDATRRTGRGDHGLRRRRGRRHRRQRRAADDRGRPRRRARRPAVGRQRVPAHALVADPRVRLARRHLRRAARVHARRRGLRRSPRSCARSRRPSSCWSSRARCRASPARCSRRPRSRSSSPSSRSPSAARRSAPGPPGAASATSPGRYRRPDRRLGLVALGVRAQRAARADHARARRAATCPPAAISASARPQLDVIGALLCGLGLAGISFGLIEQPRARLGGPARDRSRSSAACSLFAAFIALRAADARADAAARACSARRNFSVANVETFAMYGGMAVQGFFLTLFLQQVAGFSALEAGSAGLVPTGHDLPALAPLRRARRPLRAALVHDGRAAAGRGRLPALLRLDATTSYWPTWCRRCCSTRSGSRSRWRR